MIHPGFVHLGMALVWMFLSGNTTLGGLTAGLIFGFLMMMFFKNALHCSNYVRRVLAACKFVFKFLELVIQSNLRIARAVLLKDAGRIKGEFLTYYIGDLNWFETLLLCQCIGLTPGTIVTDRNQDNSMLIIHAFASGTIDEIRYDIDNELKRNILLFTR